MINHTSSSFFWMKKTAFHKNNFLIYCLRLRREDEAIKGWGTKILTLCFNDDIGKWITWKGLTLNSVLRDIAEHSRKFYFLDPSQSFQWHSMSSRLYPDTQTSKRFTVSRLYALSSASENHQTYRKIVTLIHRNKMYLLFYHEYGGKRLSRKSKHDVWIE